VTLLNKLSGRNSLACAAACLMSSFVLAPAKAELQIRGYDPARHDRFYSGANPAFIGGSLDFSGVGRVGDGGGWATMISPHYFVSAFHAQIGGSNVTFNIGNGPGAQQVTYSADGSYQQRLTSFGSSSDLYVGRLNLNQTIDPRIKNYPIANLPPTSITFDGANGGPPVTVTNPNGNYINRDILVYGLGHRVGRNRIDSINGEGPIGGTSGFATRWDYDTVSHPTSTGIDEALTQGGDSGAPDFTVINGQLALVGVRWFVTGGNLGSGSTFVPAYLSQFNGVTGTERITTLVPEPAALALLLTLPAVWLRRRRTI
jgi:hypothetical protein